MYRMVFALLLASGCTGILTRRTSTEVHPGTAKMPGDERTSKPGIASVPHTNESRKRVKAKEEPATLVADDNSRCVVNDQRFRDTSVGDWVVCPWTF